MRQLLVRLICWIRCHDFDWRGEALVCKRCGHIEPDGMKYIAKTLGGK